MKINIFPVVFFTLLINLTLLPAQQLPPGVTLDDIKNRRQEIIDRGVPAAKIDSILAAKGNEASSPTPPKAVTKPAKATTQKPADPPQKEAPTQKVVATQADITNLLQDRENEIFGHNIFLNPTEPIFLQSPVLATDDYIIGPGDIFTVTVSGRSEVSNELEVSPDGSINREFFGKVYLAGMTFIKAKEQLLRRYRRILDPGSEIEIRLSQNIRPVNVSIVGEVVKPGRYSLEATAPALNGLMKAGGVLPIGSVRDIFIKRNGKTVGVLDMYKILLEGEGSNLYLKNNDFLYVPVQKKIVKVTGAVKRPMKYELREDENLLDLLKYAGGLEYDALLTIAQVRRTVEGKEELIDFSLGDFISAGKKFRLDDGDVLIIRSIRKEIKNFVSISGAVQYGETYEMLPGETVSDLVERAGGVNDDAYLDRAYIIRMESPTEISYIPLNLREELANTNPANQIKLQYFDKLRVFSLKEFAEEFAISVNGEVRMPGTFPLSKTMTLKDLLYFVGGPKKNADLKNIELSTFSTKKEPGILNQVKKKETEDKDAMNDMFVRRISILSDWENDPMLDTILVHKYDNLRIYSRFDFVFPKYIQINGAVQSPGRYQVTPGMNLKDALYLSGGLIEEADASVIDMYHRLDIRQKSIKSMMLDGQAVDRISIDEDWQTSSATDSIDVFDFEKIYVYNKRDFIQLGSVRVAGLVNIPGTYELLPNMTLKDLLYRAGGLQISADYSNIELTRVIEKENATGEIIPISIVIKRISTGHNWQEDPVLDEVIVNTYDQIFIRKNPDFQIQESIFIAGEVNIPGEFNKNAKNEKLSSLVSRAGGITEIAYLKGAYLFRKGVGKVAIRMDKALAHPGGRYDISLLANDSIIVPGSTHIVSIGGNVLQPGTNVQFEPSHTRFKYYTNLAGGFDRRTKRKRSTVMYADGRFQRTKSFLGIKTYPKIEQGCVLNVGAKPPKKEKTVRENREGFTLEEIIGVATALVTLLILSQSLNP